LIGGSRFITAITPISYTGYDGFFSFLIKSLSQSNASLTRLAVNPLYSLFTFLLTTVTKNAASSADNPSSICIKSVSLFVFDSVLSPPL